MTDQYENLLELQKEWRELKNRAFWILVTGLFTVIGYGMWIGTIDTKVERNQQDISENKVRLNNDEARINAIEITNSSTNARLSSIDAVLQEIKLAIKQIK